MLRSQETTRRQPGDNLETINTNVSTETFYMVHFNAITQTFENHLNLDTQVHFKLIKRSKPAGLVGQHHVVSALGRQLQGFIRLVCTVIPPASPEIKARLTRWGDPPCSSSRRPGRGVLAGETCQQKVPGEREFLDVGGEEYERSSLSAL